MRICGLPPSSGLSLFDFGLIENNSTITTITICYPLSQDAAVAVFSELSTNSFSFSKVNWCLAVLSFYSLQLKLCAGVLIMHQKMCLRH